MTILLQRKSSPTLQLRQHEFHSQSEAKEYVQLFLSDLCFWEPTTDANSASSSPASQHDYHHYDHHYHHAADEEEGCREWDTKPLLQEVDLRWKAAIDPVTGRTYYYDSITLETQWDKPLELRTWQRQVKRERRRKDKAFFKKMERNILASLARGELIPGVVPAKVWLVVPPQPPQTEQTIATTAIRHNNNNNNTGGGSRVRTISGMDERVLASLQISSSNNNTHTTSTLGTTTPGHVLALRHSPPESRDPAHSYHDHRQFEGRPPLPQQRSLRSTRGAPPLEIKSSRSKEEQCKPEALPKQQMLSNNNSHVRRNTGGTIYVNSTMTNPDVKATIKCVCGVYRAHIVQGLEQQRKGRYRQAPPNTTVHVNLDIFRDDYECRRRGPVPLPSMEDIFTFYVEYFERSQMEHDTIIMSLIYVERLLKETNGTLAPNPENWRSLLFSCMILASKVWDDLSMWNVDFSNVSVATGIAPFSLARINELELGVLTSLGFDVRVPASEYAKYYFLIRTMLIRSGLLVEQDAAAAPPALSHEEAKILEHRTRQYQTARLTNSPRLTNRRSLSLSDWEWWKNPVTDPPANCLEGGPVLKDKICLEQLVPGLPVHQ
ncbi:hypothetical protein ACA910_012204 [Epithemia clementina (nom. ined.)]